jgi:putative aldouronate transport system permease protein
MYGIQIAFKEFRPSLGIWQSPWIGLSNFIRFVRFPDFLKMIRNTLSITVYQLATFPCAVILAIMFNEMQSPKFKKVVQMVTYAPHFLSTVVLCSLVLLMLALEGPVNNALVSFGLSPLEFMYRPKYFASIYVWSGVWQNIGWGSIIYLAALAGVSPELIEAARIDGAGRLQVIWHVNIPCILPTIIITFILSTGGMLNVGFEKIFLLQNPLNLDASRVISTYVYEMGIGGAQFSYASAIGLFNNVVNIILLLTVNAISRKISEIGLW